MFFRAGYVEMVCTGKIIAGEMFAAKMFLVSRKKEKIIKSYYLRDNIDDNICP